jgi:hypothetical protein
MNDSIKEYIESLGWEITDEKDTATGFSIFHKNIEDGFNTGTDYYLNLYLSKITEQLSVVIEEHYYGSWSMGTRENQYFLDNLTDLKKLMRFKRIYKIS